jgi:flagellar hook-associated protein 2
MISPIVANLGAGSGIDTAALINDLATASRTPKIRRFEALAQSNQAKISALAQAQSDLDAFASSLSDVVSGSRLRAQPVLSDESVLTAAVDAGVRLGTFSAAIEVTQLARAQSVYSLYNVSATGQIGQGNLILKVGGIDYPVNLNSGNDSLTGLAATINAIGCPVKANVATDNNGFRLVLKGESGLANSFEMVAVAGSDPALTRYCFGSGGGGMQLGQSADDAQFTIDGIRYTRAQNTVSDAIKGISLTLKSAKPGNPVALTLNRQVDAIRQTVDDFISVFNGVKANIAAARSAAGGDFALRKLDQEISGLVGLPVTSDTSINSLSDIGIATSRDGKISVNKSQLEAALAANPDAVEALFNPTRDALHSAATDPGISGALTAIKDNASASNGTLSSLRKRLQDQSDTIAANRTRTELREDAYRVRLERQFGSMDNRIAALKATQNYLEQQIKIWNSDN